MIHTAVPSLSNRSLVLATARVGNYAVLFLSPLILTRLLDLQTFGAYREFILYSMVLVGLARFGIDRSLIYFIPRDPSRESVFVSQCVLFTLVTFALAAGLFLLVHHGTSLTGEFDYPGELLLYAFFLLHLDLLESYWLGHRDSRRVLIYGALRMTTRVTAVVVAALVTGDLGWILIALIAVEALRWTLVLLYLLRKRLLNWRMDRRSLMEHWRFFAPLGASTSVQTLSNHLGQIVTLVMLGPAALALYVLGTYLEMISNVVRSAISDVIFPDMVQRGVGADEAGLALWQRSSVMYAFLLMPVACALFLQATPAVTLLFSETYAGAAPVFMVFCVILLRDSVNFGVPLRAMNRSGVVLQGTLASLAVTAVTTLPLVWQFGLLGPAVALLLGKIAEEFYMGRRLVVLTGLSLRRLLPWKSLFSLLLLSIFTVAVAETVTAGMDAGVLRMLVTLSLAAMLYLLLVRLLRIPDIDRVMGNVLQMMNPRGFLAHRKRPHGEAQ